MSTSQTRVVLGAKLRRSPEHSRYWDWMETRAGQVTGRVSFTGTLKEIRLIIRTSERGQR